MTKPSDGPWKKGQPYQEGKHNRTPVQLGSDSVPRLNIAVICGPNQESNANLIEMIPEIMELFTKAFFSLCGAGQLLKGANLPDPQRYYVLTDEMRRVILTTNLNQQEKKHE